MTNRWIPVVLVTFIVGVIPSCLFPSLDWLSTRTVDAGALSPAVDAAGADSEAALDGSGCPGHEEPRAVRVDAELCIDATEVTRGQYARFIAHADAAALQLPAGCGPNLNLTPGEWSTHQVPADAPVVFVDWCQAFAYCAWAGKRMCGRLGGGSTPFDRANDATASQWFLACSSSGQRAFPYGSSFERSTCNTNGAAGGPSAVGSSTSCTTPAGALDMSGNVYEWEDSCRDEAPVPACHIRGGSWGSDGEGASCAFTGLEQLRTLQGPDIGIRCCSP